jgi:hypothetical protein
VCCSANAGLAARGVFCCCALPAAMMFAFALRLWLPHIQSLVHSSDAILFNLDGQLVAVAISFQPQILGQKTCSAVVTNDFNCHTCVMVLLIHEHVPAIE